jgi:hypothetical protein
MHMGAPGRADAELFLRSPHEFETLVFFAKSRRPPPGPGAAALAPAISPSMRATIQTYVVRGTSTAAVRVSHASMHAQEAATRSNVGVYLVPFFSSRLEDLCISRARAPYSIAT